MSSTHSSLTNFTLKNLLLLLVSSTPTKAPSDGASGGGKPETEPKHQFPFLSKLPGSNKDKPKNIIERPSISGSETLSVSNIESSKKSTAVPHLMGNKELSRPSKVDAPFHRGGFLFKQKSTATGPKETEVVTTEPTLTSDKDGVCEPPFVSSPSAIVGDNKEGTPSKSVPAVTPYTANKASVPDSGTVRLQSKNIIDTTNHHGWSPDIGDDVMDRGVSDSNTVPDATDIAPTINFDEVYGAFLSNVRDSSDHSTSLEATILDLRVLLSNAQSDMLLMRARQASLADEMEAALESIEEVSLEAPETREDNGNTNSGD